MFKLPESISARISSKAAGLAGASFVKEAAKSASRAASGTGKDTIFKKIVTYGGFQK